MENFLKTSIIKKILKGTVDFVGLCSRCSLLKEVWKKKKSCLNKWAFCFPFCCKSRVKLYFDKIRIFKAKNQGDTFTFTITLKRNEFHFKGLRWGFFEYKGMGSSWGLSWKSWNIRTARQPNHRHFSCFRLGKISYYICFCSTLHLLYLLQILVTASMRVFTQFGVETFGGKFVFGKNGKARVLLQKCGVRVVRLLRPLTAEHTFDQILQITVARCPYST